MLTEGSEPRGDVADGRISRRESVLPTLASDPRNGAMLMVRRLGRCFVMAAMALAASLGVGRSAQANVTIDFNISPTGGNDLIFSNVAPGSYTYYLSTSNSGNSANTVQVTNPIAIFLGTYMYEVQLTITDNSANPGSQAQLIDSSVTTSTGNQTTKSDLLAVTVSDSGFSAPTGSNLTLLSSLQVTSIGDSDTVSASGSYVNNFNTSNSVTDNAGADSGKTVNNPSNHPGFTLSNVIVFALGTGSDTATVKNTVTLSDPPTTSTPEPSTIALAIAGLGTMGLVHLRRRRAAKAAA
jgi:hypothetical protein